jgi:hypothetical protein
MRPSGQAELAHLQDPPAWHCRRGSPVRYRINSGWADRAAKPSKTPARWDVAATKKAVPPARPAVPQPGRRHAVPTPRDPRPGCHRA